MPVTLPAEHSRALQSLCWELVLPHPHPLPFPPPLPILPFIPSPFSPSPPSIQQSLLAAEHSKVPLAFLGLSLPHPSPPGAPFTPYRLPLSPSNPPPLSCSPPLRPISCPQPTSLRFSAFYLFPPAPPPIIMFLPAFPLSFPPPPPPRATHILFSLCRAQQGPCSPSAGRPQLWGALPVPISVGPL